MPLSSRERVLQAIAHRETDHLPRDYRAEAPVTQSLLALLGLPDLEALEERFRVDMARVQVTYDCPYTDGRNIWGLRSESAELTTRIANHPLADATTVEQVEAYAWPKPDWADVEAFRRQAVVARRTGRAVVGSSWGSIFGESYRLMGMDGFMMALANSPDVAAAVIRHVADFFLEVDRRLFVACEGLLDISYHGNDFGSQRGLFFSRRHFREFFSRPTVELLEQAHRHGLRTMYHSCGAVSEVIPDLIECGVDVLDPVQVTASGMEPRALKERFGDQIAFHGAISTQRVLPFGTAGQVARHVGEVCRIMSRGGGYIFCPDQDITPDTPAENVLAMYEALDRLES